MNNIINDAFKHKNGATRYTHIKVGKSKSCFTSDPLNGDNKYIANDICKLTEFSVDNTYVRFVDSFFEKRLAFLWEQTVPHYWLTCFSIPMRIINSLSKAKESLLESATSHSVMYRYVGDLISFSYKRFKKFISDIYAKELTISKTTESTSVASYLDLHFTRDKNNNTTTKLDDKRYAFGFHIVNFPFISSNIPSAPACCVYASQVIHYARCCSNYIDFLSRHMALVTRLLSLGYKVSRLSNTFKKLFGRHTDLVGQYKKNVCQMFAVYILGL